MLSLRLPICHRITGLPHLHPKRSGQAAIVSVVVPCGKCTGGVWQSQGCVAVTAALWNPSTRKLLDSGHSKGRDIRFETAVQGLGIPLHPCAEKFYREKGLIK